MKERAMAIFIGLVMVFSMAGFAVMNIMPQQPAQGPAIPNVINRPLTGQEKIQILQTGRVIIEDFFEENCTNCLDTNMMLEGFAQQFGEYLVLEEVVANQTELRIIGRGGQIMDLPINITKDELFDAFCDLAMIQPKECLLREI